MLPQRRSVLYRNSELNTFLRSRSVSRRDTVFGFLAVMSVIGWAYIGLASDAVQINEVKAQGLTQLDELDVTHEVFTLLDGQSQWTLLSKRHAGNIDKAWLEKALQERIFAASVKIDRITPKTIHLTIQERSKRLILHSRQWYYWLDLQGVVTAELTDAEKRDAQARLLGQKKAELADAPIIKQNTAEPLAEGYVFGNDQMIKEWIQWNDRLRLAGLEFRELEPPQTSSTKLAVLSAYGEEVFFDITSPLETQVKTYTTFKKTDEGKAKTYEYVDARVPGRVYTRE